MSISQAHSVPIPEPKLPWSDTFIVIFNTFNSNLESLTKWNSAWILGFHHARLVLTAYRFVKDDQNPDQSPYDNLSDAAATYAVGGISNHWTAAVARQHPVVERSSIIDYEEWQVLYEESGKLLKKSDDLFQNSIRN